MSAVPVDYDALAQQSGAVASAPAPVEQAQSEPSSGQDYDAIAAQSGAIASAPASASPQESAASRFGSNFASGLGVVSKEQGKRFFTHPLDTAIKAFEAQGMLAQKARDAYQKGEYAAALQHALNYLVPFVGQQADQAGEQLKQGDYAGGVGRTLGAAVPIAAGSPDVQAGASGAASAAKDAASAVGSAAKETAAAVKDAATTENIATAVGGAVGAKLGSMAGEPVGGAAAGAAAGRMIGKSFARRAAARVASGEETGASATASEDSTADTSGGTAQESPADFVSRVAGNGRAPMGAKAPSSYRVYDNGTVTEHAKTNEMFGEGAEGESIDLRTAEQKQASLGDKAGRPQGKPQTWQRGAKKGQPKTYRVFDQGKWVELPVTK